MGRTVGGNWERGKPLECKQRIPHVVKFSKTTFSLHVQMSLVYLGHCIPYYFISDFSLPSRSNKFTESEPMSRLLPSHPLKWSIVISIFFIKSLNRHLMPCFSTVDGLYKVPFRTVGLFI